MSFAKNTKVSIDKTISEIRKFIEKAGATSFVYAEGDGQAFIAFKAKERAIKMKIDMPILSPRANEASKRTFEQIKRTKWRCLLLCIKAKIESIENGIETFDEAFLPHIVLSNGQTIGDKVILQIDEISKNPRLPFFGDGK